MATVIRFSRHGTKKKPFYRIVVQEHTAPRDGRFIEHIGHFDPFKATEGLVVERARLTYWLSTGAKMSDSVGNRVKKLMKQWATQPEVEAAAPPVKKSAKAEKAEAAPAT